jgi:hypothetical protein
MRANIVSPRTGNINNKWLTAIVFSALLTGGCQKKEAMTEDSNGISQKAVTTQGIAENPPYQDGARTQLGRMRQNPYTVTNMMAAWQSLAAAGIYPSVDAAVYPSHYYVRFKPKNSDEYERLQKDSTVAFSDIPIESTVTMSGDYYHDPSLPDSVPTYQYASVKRDYLFPKGIDYEVIDKLYIPESDKVLDYENGGANTCFVERLLNRAYIQTGNFEDTINVDNCSQLVAARRYRPAGRIRVFDTRLQQWIGMEGVRVQARRWFTIHEGYPDYNGYYQVNGTFNRPCNYSIWFAGPTFSVRHNLVNTTFWINGPKISGNWNYDLNNSYQRFAGHVFRGAFRYHMKDIGGLQRPWLPTARQVYVAKDGYKDWSGVNWIVLPVIRIARYSNSNNREYYSDEIFSTTCHETGHTSHVLRMNGGVIQFWQVSSQLQESWPVAIEWFLSNKEYAERGIPNYGQWNYDPTNPPQYPNHFAYQYWTLPGYSDDYTSLYINIVDTVNDKFLWTQTGVPDDEVKGYTLPFIEQRILKHSYGHISLMEELMRNKPAGVTDAQIKKLISYY